MLTETVVHLKVRQIFGQVWNRLYRPRFVSVSPLTTGQQIEIESPIGKPRCLHGDAFTFINITDTFRDWNMGEHGALWTYNLNYMDWLCQEGITEEEGLRWIDRFIDELPDNCVGLDPYPIALRIINWAKFFACHSEHRTKKRLTSMYAQTILLSRSLEYHLLGNHLLEDGYALFIASIFFDDMKLYHKAERLLLSQLKEQILPDGAHYEQSPMYHCIMLDRLLDCINFSGNNVLFDGQSAFTNFLCEKACAMLGHLQSIIYTDGTIPLFNDSAYGIAPTSTQLFQYAKKLGLSWETIPLNECGYRKLVHGNIEALADIGNITANYQPGHSHADTFNYELRIDGYPIIVDTGISTYNKNDRRQYERSTCAHNTVTVNNMNSSQVWGGFRLGKRARVSILEDTPQNILASHNGFGNNTVHQRKFSFNGNSFSVEDKIIGGATNAISYIHFAPNLHVQIASLEDGIIKIGNTIMKIEHFRDITLCNNYVSTEYNRLQSSYVLEISFIKHLKYTIG